MRMLDELAIGILAFPGMRTGHSTERDTMTQEPNWRVMRVLVDNHNEKTGSS